METKELNPEKYSKLVRSINDQALEECKELLRSKGDKCFIYVNRLDTDVLVYLLGDGAMDFGELVGVGVDGDDLLYCAFSFNDMPPTTEPAWQRMNEDCYLSNGSLPSVYEFIVKHLDESVTREEAVAAQESDYEGNMTVFDW